MIQLVGNEYVIQPLIIYPTKEGNSTDAESQDVQIAAADDNVIVTWWERNSTSNEPVVTISTDNGTTFGSIMKLAVNGTIGRAE